jgi:DNA-binding MarR family transcriptional regulator
LARSVRRFGCARNQKRLRCFTMTLRQSRALHGTVTFRLHTLAKLTDRVSQAAYLADAGLPIGEGRCLSAIGSFRPLSVNDLAAAANLDKGQASRAAQSLVAQGLVRKEASPTDGRGVVLTLTAKGERVWRRVMDLVERRNAEITACLSAAERAQLDRLLDRLVMHARSAVA